MIRVDLLIRKQLNTVIRTLTRDWLGRTWDTGQDGQSNPTITIVLPYGARVVTKSQSQSESFILCLIYQVCISQPFMSPAEIGSRMCAEIVEILLFLSL